MQSFRIYNNILTPPIEQRLLGFTISSRALRPVFLPFIAFIITGFIILIALPSLMWLAIVLFCVAVLLLLIYVIIVYRFSFRGLPGDVQLNAFRRTKKTFPMQNFVVSDPEFDYIVGLHSREKNNK